jgi:hypothetical protein
MDKKIIKIYDIFSTHGITADTLELSKEIFENHEIQPFPHQGDSILVEMAHDCFFSFLVFVADQSIKKINKKYDKK